MAISNRRASNNSRWSGSTARLRRDLGSPGSSMRWTRLDSTAARPDDLSYRWLLPPGRRSIAYSQQSRILSGRPGDKPPADCCSKLLDRAVGKVTAWLSLQIPRPELPCDGNGVTADSLAAEILADARDIP